MTKELSAIPNQEPSIGSMLQSVIQQGVTAENVTALERLCDLYERMQTKSAQQAFAAAFVELQRDLPAIQAVKAVPNKDGTIRYKFAPYEEIMQKVSPLLAKHNFTVSFNSKFGDGRINVICTLMHAGGHSRENEFAVRIGGGPPGATETQADGAAKTYAKRGALCDCLNIVIEHDDDARAEGGTISDEQCEYLKRRVEATKTDAKKFLALAGAESFETIAAAKYGFLDDTLSQRAAKQKAQPAGERDADGNFRF